MKRRHLVISTVVCCVLFYLGCGSTGPQPTKPASDPDDGIAGTGKSDFLTNYFTTIQGEIRFGQTISSEIDYPDWYHGYTIAMSQPGTISIDVTSQEEAIVALYGPAYRFEDGQPLFKKALKKMRTKDANGTNLASVTVKIKTAGTYMVVYGPEYEWDSVYGITLGCVEGCRRPGECFSDLECAPSDYCGDNGVRCIAYPCTAHYFVCKPRESIGAFCDRDQACADGLLCKDNVCALAETPCESSEDCPDGFCGCADEFCEAKICKLYSKEGERCGGHVPPYLARICEDGLNCVTIPLMFDGPGTCRLVKTVAELLETPEIYDGKRVTIEGYISHLFAMCTLMACPSFNPCCNACSAKQVILDELPSEGDFDSGILLEKDGQLFSCGGNECTYADNCTVKESRYRVVGTFVYTPESQKIVVESYLEMP